MPKWLEMQCSAYAFSSAVGSATTERFSAADALGITQREAEIPLRVSYVESNSAISDVLTISPCRLQ